MRVPTIEIGLAHVACSKRVGNITKVGPVTGKSWPILLTGSWIDVDDAEILVDRKEEVWCFKSNDFINIHTVFYL